MNIFPYKRNSNIPVQDHYFELKGFSQQKLIFACVNSTCLLGFFFVIDNDQTIIKNTDRAGTSMRQRIFAALSNTEFPTIEFGSGVEIILLQG